MADNEVWEAWLAAADEGRALDFLIDAVSNTQKRSAAEARNVVSFMVGDFFSHLHSFNDAAGPIAGPTSGRVHYYGVVNGLPFWDASWLRPASYDARSVLRLAAPIADLRVRSALEKFVDKRMSTRRMIGETFGDAWGSFDGVANRRHLLVCNREPYGGGDVADQVEGRAFSDARRLGVSTFTATIHVDDLALRHRLDEIFLPPKHSGDVGDAEARAEAARRLGACALAWSLRDKTQFTEVLRRLEVLCRIESLAWRECRNAMALHAGRAKRTFDLVAAAALPSGAAALDLIIMKLDRPTSFLTCCKTIAAAGRALGFRPPRLVLDMPDALRAVQTAVWEPPPEAVASACEAVEAATAERVAKVAALDELLQNSESSKQDIAAARALVLEASKNLVRAGAAEANTVMRVRKHAALPFFPMVVTTSFKNGRVVDDTDTPGSGSGVANATNGGMQYQAIPGKPYVPIHVDEHHPMVSWKIYRQKEDGSLEMLSNSVCRRELVHAHRQTLGPAERVAYRGSTDALAKELPNLPDSTFVNPVVSNGFPYVPTALSQPRLMIHALSSQLEKKKGVTDKMVVEATLTFETAGWKGSSDKASAQRSQLHFEGPYTLTARSKPFVCVTGTADPTKRNKKRARE